MAQQGGGPVSYTHLDVYKRQLLDHNGLQIDGTNDEVMGVGDMMAKYCLLYTSRCV